MSLKEQVYSVLFVSSAERFNIGFSAVLQETPCEPVVTVSSVSAAEQTLTQRSFDFIFINLANFNAAIPIFVIPDKTSTSLLFIFQKSSTILEGRLLAFKI